MPQVAHRAARAAGWLLSLLCATCAVAEPPPPSADEVKAVYVHKFPGYVDWPPGLFPTTTAPFVLGVVGAEAVHAELVRLAASRPVQGRSVVVRRFSDPASCGELHLVFVGRDAAPPLERWLAACRSLPVVTVTDAANGVERGAMLAFVEVEQRVRFEASPSAAERAGVKLSSRLLAVAERIGAPRP
jgi:hypothetical protein